MRVARTALHAPNACNVLHVQASLPLWQCDYLVECMLNARDWETLQSRAAPGHAEGFEWIEGTGRELEEGDGGQAGRR